MNEDLCYLLNEFLEGYPNQKQLDPYLDFYKWLREREPEYNLNKDMFEQAGKNLIKLYHSHRRSNDTWRQFNN